MNTSLAEVKDAIERQTDTLLGDRAVLAEVTSALEGGFDRLGDGLRQVCHVVDSGFQELSYKLDLQYSVLLQISETLKHPLETAAKELRNRAEFAYINGWIDEAEADLLEAERHNYQDFVVQHMLGNIQLYHRNDYPRAAEYYERAAKYGAPRSSIHASRALVQAAMAYHRQGKLREAYQSTKGAVALSPSDSQVRYEHCRHAVVAGETSEFLSILAGVILEDEHFLVAACCDDLLREARHDIEVLAERLEAGKREAVALLLERIDDIVSQATSLGLQKPAGLQEELADVERVISKGGFLSTVKAERSAKKRFRLLVAEWSASASAELAKLKSERLRLERMPGARTAGCLVGVLATLVVCLPAGLLDPRKEWAYIPFAILFFAVPWPVAAVVESALVRQRTRGVRRRIEMEERRLDFLKRTEEER